MSRSGVLSRCWTTAASSPSAVRELRTYAAKISAAGSTRQVGGDPVA